MPNQRILVNRTLFITICVYILYSFWFQYAFNPINGFLSALGIVMLLLSFTTIHLNKDYYKVLFPLLFFIIICTISGILFSSDSNYSLTLVIQVLEYCIPAYAIYVYVDSEIKNLNNLMIVLLIICSVLAVWSFYKPIYSMSYGSLQSNSSNLMNANVFSSYMMVGVIGGTFSLDRYSNKNKAVVYACILVILFAQLLAASRRGIIICFLIIIAYYQSSLTLNKSESFAKKLSSVLLILGFVYYIISELPVLSKVFIGIQRLQGMYVGGDKLRKYYREVALDIFSENPIFGKGLGAVSLKIGMYSHSFYFELLACTGIIGTLLMLCYLFYFLVFYLKNSLSIYTANPNEMLLSRLFFWYVLAVLLSGIAVVLIYDSYFYILIALFAAAHRVIINPKMKNNYSLYSTV